MTSLSINQDQASTAIIIFDEKAFSSWKSKEAAFVQNWIQAQSFEGKGHLVIPDMQGKTSCVIYVLDNLKPFFIAADLALNLPSGNYTLDISQLALSSDEENDLILRFATSWGLSNYRFDRYKTNEKAINQLLLDSEALLSQATHCINAISLVRDMVNTPAGDMMPENMSELVDKLGEQFSGKVKHIVGDDLLTENYPAIHAVGRASIHAPRLIDLEWGDPNAPKITLVGKGVCFDSGGLDLKPANAMRLMKKDMGGAAHVLGLAYLIMANQLPVRLRVMIPAVENAVSSNAFRPGDILNTRQGISVEVDNTDAEGRLVLCDALTEASSENPDIILDFATLTGACRVALGTELPGFFCNEQGLASSLQTLAAEIDDPVWQLPLHKPYQDMLKSDIADTLNSAASGFGGAITAALYLQLFVNSDTPWVHFDVMAWNNRRLPGRPVGGEAFGIRAVYEYLRQRYES